MHGALNVCKSRNHFQSTAFIYAYWIPRVWKLFSGNISSYHQIKVYWSNEVLNLRRITNNFLKLMEKINQSKHWNSNVTYSKISQSIWTEILWNWTNIFESCIHISFSLTFSIWMIMNYHYVFVSNLFVFLFCAHLYPITAQIKNI